MGNGFCVKCALFGNTIVFISIVRNPQYYDDTFPSLKEQTKFEKSLFKKTHKANGVCVCVGLCVYMHVCVCVCVCMCSCLVVPPACVGEIIMHEGVTAVYRSNVDLFFYVIGAQTENEVCTHTRHTHNTANAQTHAYQQIHSFKIRVTMCVCVCVFQLMLMAVLNGLYDALSLVLR